MIEHACDVSAVSADPAMPFVALALDPAYMRPRLASLVQAPVSIDAVRVTRWKPGRRCLIEYDLSIGRRGAETPLTLVGKVKARALDRSTFELTGRLACRLEAVGTGCSVPATRGAIPECHMWVQEKVGGVPAWIAINSPGGPTAARRIGRALACLQGALAPLSRSHSISDEIGSLAEALDRAGRVHPGWNRRLSALLGACERIALAMPPGAEGTVHRDFYHDQVLVEPDRVWILDLDLAAAGDPALDVGNFVAHLAEQSLRMYGDADARAAEEAAFVAGFLEEGGRASAGPVAVFKTLSLARHIYISTLFESRRPFTEGLLTLCEHRLRL